MEYDWDVFLPGEDLPRRISTDYLLTEGEEISVDGAWIVESVDAPSRDETVGRITVVAPHDPAIE